LPSPSQELLALDTWRNTSRFFAQARSFVGQTLFK
jgi:hypothetical protein